MAKTLLLSQAAWDLVLDEAGQIRTTLGPYAVAQNVANRIRLFRDDAWYDGKRGVPHFILDLGQRPAPSAVRAEYTRAAMEIDGVASATVSVEYDGDRVQGGDIQLTLTDGGNATVAI